MLTVDIETLRQQGDQTREIEDSVELFDLSDEMWTFEGNVSGRLHFHLVGEDVHMRGQLRARAVGQCVRTLADVPVEVSTPINYIYFPERLRPKGDVGHENLHFDANAPETAYYRERRIEPLDQIRESILLALPDFPHTAEALEHIDEVITFGMDASASSSGGSEEPEWKQKLRRLKEAG